LIHDPDGVMAKMSEHETSMEAAARGSPLAGWRSSALGELSLAALDAELKWMLIPGGQILFRENEVADSLYVVLTGCLGVIVRDNNGRDILIARIAAGETVGEMGLLDGGVRGSTPPRPSTI
jgi:CRP-like cAMP-binding protein